MTLTSRSLGSSHNSESTADDSDVMPAEYAGLYLPNRFLYLNHVAT